MTRIPRARMSFEGFHGSPERASAISQRALRQLAARAPEAAGSPRERVQLIVRAPHGASDAAIADRVADAIARQLGGHSANRRGTGT